jgi:hypothetical protein
MQPVLNCAFTRFRPQIAREQRQHVLAANFGAQHPGLGREQLVEGVDVDLCALELRPCVFEVVGSVGAPDDVGGQPALGLEPRKRLERRSGQHPTEIPDYRLDHRSLPE